jgi:hypothetical protein
MSLVVLTWITISHSQTKSCESKHPKRSVKGITLALITRQEGDGRCTVGTAIVRPCIDD